ncbi:MAG: redoxin domain-containing protein [Bacteroidetes bacterium]|jgi:hypothetical protein|nr:redoxin domain-containing protein [Bacteroidota bacterium]|tara:strand:- start:12 stop:512 length:501 start_codon:yes stop_codon:yes gene_type:complete
MWTVWVFLAPLCPICQDYTYYLNQLDAAWQNAADDQIELVGWFPNPAVTEEALVEFAERYEVSWPLALDTVGWADALGASWTPEVFVLDSLGTIRYRGRINDLYFALGKHRNTPRGHDLRDAVEALLEGGTPVVSNTDVIGCPIEKRTPFNENWGHAIFPALKSAN